MRPIKYSERIPCSYQDYGCRETSCPFNIFHKPIESYFAIHDIPSDRCLYILDMISDEELDIAIRIWMKDVFIDKKRRNVPPELTKLIERKAAEMVKPSTITEGTKDIQSIAKQGSDKHVE